MGYEGELPVEEQILTGLLKDRKKSIKTVDALKKKAQPLLDSLKEYGSEAKVSTPFERYDADAPASTPKDFHNFLKSIVAPSMKMTEELKSINDLHSDRAIVYGDGTVIRAHPYTITTGKLNIEGLSGDKTEPVGFIYTSNTIKQIKETIDAYKGMQGFEDVGAKLEALKSKFKAGQFYSFKDYDDMWVEATGGFMEGSFGEKRNLRRYLEVLRPKIEGSVKRGGRESDFFSVGGKDKQELLKRLKALESISDAPIHLNVSQDTEKIEILHPRFKEPIMVLDNKDENTFNTMNTGMQISFLISALQSDRKAVSFTQKRSSSPPPAITVDNGSSYTYISPVNVNSKVFNSVHI